MKKIILLFITVFLFYSCKEKKTVDVNIIPVPVSVTPGNDWITLGKKISLVATTKEEKNVAVFLQQFLATKGIQAFCRITHFHCTLVQNVGTEIDNIKFSAFALVAHTPVSIRSVLAEEFLLWQ